MNLRLQTERTREIVGLESGSFVERRAKRLHKERTYILMG